MSRSRKRGEPARRSWLDADPDDQPGTEKAGARRRPDHKPRSTRQTRILVDRRTYGSTEKILRRNRRLWSRLFSKEGRRLDKLAVTEEMIHFDVC